MTLHSAGNSDQLRRALAISIAAHILLLWPTAPQHLPERAAGAITATLRPVAAVAPPVLPAAVTPPSPQRAAVLPAPISKKVVAAVTPAASPESPPGMPVPLVPSTAAGGERSPPDGTVPVPAAAGAAPGRDGAGLDADGLRQYRLALAREARRYKRYPERALLAGIGGTVEVRVEHGAGAMPVTRLVRSSGDESLDAAALGMVRQAAPRTAIPDTLRGRGFAVSLPVIFDVSEE